VALQQNSQLASYSLSLIVRFCACFQCGGVALRERLRDGVR